MKKNTASKSRQKLTTDPSLYPKGWDRKRVQRIIDHYENQSDEDAIAEAELASEEPIDVPSEVDSEI